uniref:Uncharacterized protein n=1 Tax=Sphaerodactylus townsendi TaxID=933632 RepID=A0ACB8EUF6_9SAUR
MSRGGSSGPGVGAAAAAATFAVLGGGGVSGQHRLALGGAGAAGRIAHARLPRTSHRARRGHQAAPAADTAALLLLQRARRCRGHHRPALGAHSGRRGHRDRVLRRGRRRRRLLLFLRARLQQARPRRRGGGGGGGSGGGGGRRGFVDGGSHGEEAAAAAAQAPGSALLLRRVVAAPPPPPAAALPAWAGSHTRSPRGAPPPLSSAPPSPIAPGLRDPLTDRLPRRTLRRRRHRASLAARRLLPPPRSKGRGRGQRRGGHPRGRCGSRKTPRREGALGNKNVWRRPQEPSLKPTPVLSARRNHLPAMQNNREGPFLASHGGAQETGPIS